MYVNFVDFTSLIEVIFWHPYKSKDYNFRQFSKGAKE